MAAAWVAVVALVSSSAGVVPWSSIVQSGDPQPHTRTGQLVDAGPIMWGMSPARREDEEAAEASVTVEVDPTTRRQTVHGFGGAFTEAAAYVFANLPYAAQQRVLEEYWGSRGIGYTTGRVAMNSPDFALSHYSYANVSGDFTLSAFQSDLPRDNEWVLPFLRAAIKTAGKPGALRLFSAPWSPPAWMKVPFNDWPENVTEPDPKHPGTMDACRPDSLLNSSDVRRAWAMYFSKWHTAMAAQIGQPLWGFSAQNEPAAHGHMWDCCGYTLGSYTSFVSEHLMPRMKADHPDLNFMAWDHNPDQIETWVNATYADAVTREWAWGAAVHWYSAENYRGIALNNTHKAHPDKPILHTEGCACRTLPFAGDAGWWKEGEGYGIGLVQYMQNWAVGFTDWNLLLDAVGGPYHDRGFGCNAAFMACPTANASCAPDGVAYQAPFFFMAHFSKYFVPNSTVIGAMVFLGSSAPSNARTGRFYYAPGAEGADGKLAVVSAIQPNGTTVLVALNTGDAPVKYTLRDRRMGADSKGEAVLTIPEHSIQTLLWNVPSALGREVLLD